MLQNQRILRFRPARRPTAALPLTVRSCGHYRLVEAGWKESTPPKGFHELFWCSAGAGSFARDGERSRVEGGDAWYYRPGERHEIRLESPGWEYRWLTVDAEPGRSLLERLPWPRAAWRAGPCPADDFAALLDAVADPTPAGERRASCLGYRIMVAALFGSMESRAAEPMAAKCREWMDAAAGDVSLTVEGIAVGLGVHRVTLFRQFRRAYGVSPSVYLQRSRLQRGLSLLRETELPVAEVAWRCGFADPNYFARAVRAAKGLSPGAFRRTAAG